MYAITGIAPRARTLDQAWDLVRAVGRMIWADTLAGFAAYGAAMCGCPLHTSPDRWNKTDLKGLRANVGHTEKETPSYDC